MHLKHIHNYLAKRLVEHGQDVMILLDSITRLTRSYNLICSPSGRTLSGGLDPNCLYMPKRFFGLSSINKIKICISLLFSLTAKAISFKRVVFPAFGGETIIPL